METKACRRCRRLFQYIGGDIYCPLCKDELENLFKEVKSYIWEHKGCSIPEVIKATGCKEANIEQWVREERLILDEGTGIQFFCEQCGTQIFSGKLCAKCKAETANMLGSIYGEKKPSQMQAPKRFSDASHNEMYTMEMRRNRK